MQQMTLLRLAVLCTIVWSSRASAEDPPTVCKNSSECGPNRCCLLGRYIGSEPSCLAAPQEDGTCRPGQVASNATIYGPDGMPKYNVTNVYIDVCPCGQGLFCDRNSGGVCKRST